MNIESQIRFMEGRIKDIPNINEKVRYIARMFGGDPRVKTTAINKLILKIQTAKGKQKR